MERITLLKQFCQEEPHNPFNWYALAIELKKTNHDEANGIFEKLLVEFPDYLPTYYQAAHFFIEAQKYRDAKKCFEKGIEIAEKNQETKTLKELKSTFETFIFEFEEEIL